MARRSEEEKKGGGGEEEEERPRGRGGGGAACKASWELVLLPHADPRRASLRQRISSQLLRGQPISSERRRRGEGGVVVATGEHPRPVAAAEPAETHAGSDWQPARWAGPSGRPLPLIGQQEGCSFFFYITHKGLSDWPISPVPDWTLRCDQEKDLILIGC